MSKLKECPFCGDCGAVRMSSVYQDTAFCENCGAEINIKTWQSRPIEDELISIIERLKEDGERLYAGFADKVIGENWNEMILHCQLMDEIKKELK